MSIRHDAIQSLVLAVFLLLASLPLRAAEPTELPLPLQAKRILFLGDSITHAGGYVYRLETQLRLQGLDPLPEIINLGLSSETCTGLSEPDHPFPRPNVQGRLDRALETLKPDVVVACYGMNDGIYHPFSEQRFTAYQQGIQRIVDRSRAIGAKVILLTPPPFDALMPGKKGQLVPAGADKYAYFAVYENYDEVMQRYGKWVLQQGDNADLVIDLHTPIASFVAQQRKQNPEFTAAPDGVHPNEDGHRILSRVLLNAFGVQSYTEPDPELLKLVRQRGSMLHDAWLSEIGHERPGVKAGLPIDQAIQKAAQLNELIEQKVAVLRQPKFEVKSVADGKMFLSSYPATLQPGQLQLNTDYFLWVPNGVQTIRGVVVHQHGCGVGASDGGETAAYDLQWQALARKWNCALLGSSYEANDAVNCRTWCDPRNGSATTFVTALHDFAQQSDHPELDNAPWCLWGHSGGGYWASLMQTLYPQRIVAIWLQSGTAFASWQKGEIPVPDLSPEVYGVPVMGNPGLKEKTHPRFKGAWNGTLAMQQAYLDAGAPFFEFAPDPLTGHECGDSRTLAIPFFDFWLQHRLPVDGDHAATLKPVDADMLMDWSTQMAPQLKQFSDTGRVDDSTPPPAPEWVKSERLPGGSIRVTWSARADLESGLRGFVIQRDGKEVATLPEKLNSRFGRPLFQGMSYHDTPQLPLPKMEFVDTDAPTDRIPVYSIDSINGAKLKSAEPAVSQ